eukprot:6434305-Amphidinium_carterae.1
MEGIAAFSSLQSYLIVAGRAAQADIGLGRDYHTLQQRLPPRFRAIRTNAFSTCSASRQSAMQKAHRRAHAARRAQQASEDFCSNLELDHGAVQAES